MLDKNHGHKAHKKPSSHGSVVALCRAASLNTIFVEQISNALLPTYSACCLTASSLLLLGRRALPQKRGGFSVPIMRTK